MTGAASLSLKLDPGAINVTGTTSRSMPLTATTAFTLTATNSQGTVNRIFTVTVMSADPPSGDAFSLAPYTGPFAEEQARTLFERFGFGAPPERIAQASEQTDSMRRS